eukprot:g80354.t1
MVGCGSSYEAWVDYSYDHTSGAFPDKARLKVFGVNQMTLYSMQIKQQRILNDQQQPPIIRSGPLSEIVDFLSLLRMVSRADSDKQRRWGLAALIAAGSRSNLHAKNTELARRLSAEQGL